MTSPIIGVAPSIVGSTATGLARRTARRMVLDELGFWAPFRTEATTSQGDATRELNVVALGSDGMDPAQFDGGFLYVLDGAQVGEVRRVWDGSHRGPSQSLLLDRPFSSALAAGTNVELSWPLPASRWTWFHGVNECIDQALRRINVEVWVTLTGNGTYSYDIGASYPAIAEAGQLLGTYDTLYQAVPTVQVPAARPADLRTNGATRTVVTGYPYGTGDTFYAAFAVQADRYVSDGTAWAFQDAGLGLLTDAHQTTAPATWVRAFAMVMALRQWTKMVTADRRMDKQTKAETLGDIADQRQHWTGVANLIVREHFPRAAARPRDARAGVSLAVTQVDPWPLVP